MSNELRALLSTQCSALSTTRWWEIGGWAAVVTVAGVLRLAALGDLPLDTAEARPALEAWRLWLGHPPRDLDSSALLVHALELSFSLLGASDLVARLPAAVAGLALTLAPLLLRPVLGALAAVGAGALLALSPLAVFASRRVDSAILVAALLALLVGACVQIARRDEAADGEAGRDRIAPYAVPVLAALLLAAGSVAVPAALAVLAAAAATWWPEIRGRGATAGDRGPWPLAPARWPLSPAVALALFAGTLVLVGTAGLTHLRGLQAALVDPWVSWLVPYHPRATPIPWLPTLLLYELPLVGAAAAGLAVVLRRDRPWEHFLLWWTAFAALPLVFQPSDPVPYLLVWAVPLALLGGTAIGALPALDWTWRSGAQSALLLVLLVLDGFFVVNTTRGLLSTLALPAGVGAASGGRLLALSAVVLMILVYLHWHLRTWWQEESPARVGALGALALGLVFMVAVNGRLNQPHLGQSSPELVRPEVLSADVRTLVEEMQAWARQMPNTPIAVSEALRPSLLWHLRDVPTVQFQEQPPEGRVVRSVWPAGPGAPAGERRPWRETVASAPIPTTGALWSWWLHRNAWLAPTRHDIIVVR